MGRQSRTSSRSRPRSGGAEHGRRTEWHSLRLARVGSKKTRSTASSSPTAVAARRPLHRDRGALQPADRSFDDRSRHRQDPGLDLQGRAAERQGEAPHEDTGHLVEELLAYLARNLVDRPDEVRVERTERDGAVVLRLHVAEEDIGKVIGRQGRIARALRTLVRATAGAARSAPSSRSLTPADAAGGDRWVTVGRVGRPHGLAGASSSSTRATILSAGEGCDVYVEREPATVVESKTAGGRRHPPRPERAARGALELPEQELPSAAMTLSTSTSSSADRGGGGRPRARRVQDVIPAWRTTCSSSRRDRPSDGGGLRPCGRSGGGRIVVAPGFVPESNLDADADRRLHPAAMPSPGSPSSGLSPRCSFPSWS